MNAISLWQPFASLIADRIKMTETRHWHPRAELLGDRIAIHATKRKISKDDWLSFPDAMQKAIIDEWGPSFERDIPYGAIVATAVLSDVGRVVRKDSERLGCVQINFMQDPSETLTSIPTDPFGDYSSGRCIWFLRSIEKLKVPIECSGQRNFWNCDREMGTYNHAKKFAEDGNVLDHSKD